MNILNFARERCIHDPALVVLLAVGGVAIFLAYASITNDIRWVGVRLRRAPFLPLWVLFGCFIFACGCTHLFETLVIFRPAFYLLTVTVLGTAVVSVLTALLLRRSRARILQALEAAEDLRRAVSEAPPSEK